MRDLSIKAMRASSRSQPKGKQDTPQDCVICGKEFFPHLKNGKQLTCASWYCSSERSRRKTKMMRDKRKELKPDTVDEYDDGGLIA